MEILEIKSDNNNIKELTKDLKYDLRETFARILKSISQG